MTQTRIKIAYRHVIDVSSKTPFERNVFNDSYSEFLVQSQTYNPEAKFKTFGELTDSNPKANSLHYKVGFSIGLYVKELEGKIPGLTDAFNQKISFATHRFEILNSHLTNKLLHQVAIVYETDPLILFDHIADQLVLGYPDQQTNNEFHETFMIRMQSNLMIFQWHSRP